MKIEITEAKTPADFAICMAIRMEVFVFEQNVPAEEEWDSYDKSATHYFARVDGRPVATARLRDMDHIAKIERMAVRAEFRGQHVGDALLQYVLEQAKAKGFKRARLHAQTHAVAFYKKIGFRAEGGEFMEAGIPHRAMERDL